MGTARLERGDDPRVHDALTQHVGRPVTLEREGGESHFDEGPLHLVGTGALERVGREHGGVVDPRRLRANVVVETGDSEQEWAGRIGQDASDALRQALTDLLGESTAS